MDKSKIFELTYKELQPFWHEIEADFTRKQKIYQEFLQKDHNNIGKVLKFHLILENYISNYLKREFPSRSAEIEAWTFYQKTQNLPDTKMEVNWLRPAIIELNRVRNKFAHNIETIMSTNDLIEIGKILKVARSDKEYIEPISMISEFVAIASAFLDEKNLGVQEIFDNAWKKANEKQQ